MANRRLTLANVQLVGKTWEEISFELQRFLEALNDTQDEDALPPNVSSGPDCCTLISTDISGFSTYTVADGDKLLLVDASGGAVTIVLPNALTNEGRQLHIKKVDSSFNFVTLTPTFGALIDGDPSFDLEAKDEAVRISNDGTNWVIL